MTRHSRHTPQFYLTAPSTCPYLPGRRKVFTHLVGERAADLNDLLTQGGFRRSQSIAYRPACENCRACVSVRVLVDEFRPTRSLRRVRQRNADVSSEMRVATPTPEQYGVFRAYLDARHPDGGMADMTLLNYAMMIEDSYVNTCLVEYRRRSPRVAPVGAATSSPSHSPMSSMTGCRWCCACRKLDPHVIADAIHPEGARTSFFNRLRCLKSTRPLLSRLGF